MAPKYATGDNDVVEQMLVKLLAGNRTLYRYCVVEAKNCPSNPHGLTENEVLAVWVYSSTTIEWYKAINGGLWNKPEPDIEFFAELLSEALQKLPKYSGQVFRGFRHPDLDTFLKTHRVGATVQWLGFTSCSSSLDQAYPGNLLFTINSHNGRVLGEYADNPEEKEILFDCGTWFRVAAVERIGDYAVVELEEIPS